VRSAPVFEWTTAGRGGSSSAARAWALEVAEHRKGVGGRDLHAAAILEGP
jgi:hypothetical protein